MPGRILPEGHTSQSPDLTGLLWSGSAHCSQFLVPPPVQGSYYSPLAGWDHCLGWCQLFHLKQGGSLCFCLLCQPDKCNYMIILHTHRNLLISNLVKFVNRLIYLLHIPEVTLNMSNKCGVRVVNEKKGSACYKQIFLKYFTLISKTLQNNILYIIY